ncbi:hypothetical protein THAOC_27455 [Thalassiosira oceanica]|uniref:Uncharacterized protein n=1 Tax=Thalassiosira oceanica TaxID=159749 RepID=K0RHH1_THAOC|nr:hypothetical protein THAOC_27455 [Thalassiosira oceanica]|eukprot:EJK53163.1 hypothetical protein THAOC_27455 [Thalassiosira oceanica]
MSVGLGPGPLPAWTEAQWGVLEKESPPASPTGIVVAILRRHVLGGVEIDVWREGGKKLKDLSSPSKRVFASLELSRSAEHPTFQSSPRKSEREVRKRPCALSLPYPPKVSLAKSLKSPKEEKEELTSSMNERVGTPPRCQPRPPWSPAAPSRLPSIGPGRGTAAVLQQSGPGRLVHHRVALTAPGVQRPLRSLPRGREGLPGGPLRQPRPGGMSRRPSGKEAPPQVLVALSRRPWPG